MKKLKQIFEILEYVVVNLLLLALAIIGALALVVHAIKVSF